MPLTSWLAVACSGVQITFKTGYNYDTTPSSYVVEQVTNVDGYCL